MAKVVLQSESLPCIEVITGPDRGASIPLSGSRITIGRSNDNDIVVESENVSRNHAEISQHNDGFWIRDNDSKNGVLVNGAQRNESLLSDGDEVAVGDFIFRFHFQTHSPKAVEPADFLQDLPVETSPPKRQVRKAGNRSIIYLGLILFLGAAYWLSSSDPNSETKSKAQPTHEANPRQGELTASPANPVVAEPGIKRTEENLSRYDWGDPSIREAEQYFRKGARELSNRNYHRAIESFQTALQIDKRHIGAKRYLTWAVQEAEYEAKKRREIAIQYYESLQYDRAIEQFQEVIMLMSHRPADPMVGQAEKYISYAKQALEAAEVFP